MKNRFQSIACRIVLLTALLIAVFTLSGCSSKQSLDDTLSAIDQAVTALDEAARAFESNASSTAEASATENTESTLSEASDSYTEYFFRSLKLLNEHYEKHGKEMGFKSAEEYEHAASDVINNPEALSKTEAEDGDYVYYVEATNEFVILSVDGFIRTYFLPNAGINYYNRQ